MTEEEPKQLPPPEDGESNTPGNVKWDFSDLINQCTVEYLILADAIDVHSGKMYIHAGGWNGAMIGQFPGKMRWAAGTRINVPWEATNIEHNLKVDLVDQDNQSILTGHQQPLDITFNTGRPPNLPRGASQALPIAFDLSEARFPGVGVYALTLQIDGRWAAKSTIHVFQAPNN